ncbi:hypothetical protein SCA03_62140 [Streptomyces cacaoi]|uniref:Uncharacterized protein n=1 Tax=Streptomyces cacaoi TaxID=1898 RepID=A0A4Y3RAE6_STRCI|nr:hypothetical protein SCA03_62140 [Streptomyces cacaoi]
MAAVLLVVLVLDMRVVPPGGGRGAAPGWCRTRNLGNPPGNRHQGRFLLRRNVDGYATRITPRRRVAPAPAPGPRPARRAFLSRFVCARTPVPHLTAGPAALWRRSYGPAHGGTSAWPARHPVR